MTDSYSNVLNGISEQAHPGAAAAIASLSLGKLPERFPLVEWNEQALRYREYWKWFTGEKLEETIGITTEGEVLWKYPLKINPIRTYSRIHNSMLWGEVPDDNHPPIRSRIRPAQTFYGDEELTDEQRKITKFYERIVDEVWSVSNARAILWEAGLISQFLGGAYFQVKWTPWRKDLRIPFTIRYLKPDFVLPVWNPEDEFDLTEAYIIYRVPSKAIEETYGVEPSANPIYSTYIEYWNREEYSVFVDGNPLDATFHVPLVGKVKYSFDRVKHPFGIVPITYIPRLREGSFFGSSIVPDIHGMAEELNVRLADTGDIVHKNNDRKWFGRNISQQPKERKTSDGTIEFIDLGPENPALKSPPEIWAEDPPVLTPAMGQFTDDVQAYMERAGSVSPVTFGIDEGSQRSNGTLATRMYPTISMARSQRNNWTTGKNRIDRNILIMSAALNLNIGSKSVPKTILTEVEIGQQWHVYIPRDEEQVTNRIAILTGADQMSTHRSLEIQGDVEDIELEKKRIAEDVKLKAELSGSNQENPNKIEAPAANTQVNNDGD